MTGGHSNHNLKHLQVDDPSQLFDRLLDAAHHQHIRFIHIEPSDSDYLIRTKSGGHLHQFAQITKTQASAFFDFLRARAHLPSTNRAFPQDATFTEGRFLINFTSLPTINGEKVFLHLTNQSRLTKNLSTLGLSGDDLSLAQSITDLHSGLVLVLGAGKTTTMFSLLSLFDATKLNISTIESRPSYRLPNVNQFLNTSNQVTHLEQAFIAATRQHSDVILLSQIDSPRLAELAVDTANNHRIIITSLPINDPFAAADFIVNLGVQPFLVLHTLRFILSQKLISTTDDAHSLTGSFESLKIDDHYRQLFLAGLTPAEIRSTKNPQSN